MRRRAEAPSGVMTLRVTDEERRRIKEAAAANFQSASDFARDAIVTAAAETLEEDTDEQGDDGEEARPS